MSYYRYITGVYKSYWPELNRTLRSSSVPRHVPQLDTARNSRASSVPPSACFSPSFFTRHSATPFRDRAMSVPPRYSWDRPSATPATPVTEGSHFSDFDFKVIDYMGQLERQDMVKSQVTQTRYNRASRINTDANAWYSTNYTVDNFASRYNYYDGNKHSGDYLYPITADVLGSWKHYNLSADTLNYRNSRAKSPLVTRELNRYYEKRANYVGDMSSAGSDFRHYNYRRVPYFGGSDGYQFMKTKPFRGGRGF
eukprot:TRINITY_DN3274_c0_g1_i5.p1 TRINITY_DN3274_c0_g1~~TRINITY_DN3274_c0_g1_i5.p1  ORF type:complete len:253 (-),score=61.62 TRINITY_DN3274_c0_g1_i5:164-922(-)